MYDETAKARMSAEQDRREYRAGLANETVAGRAVATAQTPLTELHDRIISLNAGMREVGQRLESIADAVLGELPKSPANSLGAGGAPEYDGMIGQLFSMVSECQNTLGHIASSTGRLSRLDPRA